MPLSNAYTADALAQRCARAEIKIELLQGEVERLRAALKIAREYVVRVDGTMALIAPENRATKPDLDLIDAALKE